MSNKTQKHEGQSSFDFDAKIEDTSTQTTKGNTVENFEDNNETNDVQSGKPIKKIDNYVPPVSPHLAEMNALSNVFSNFAKLPSTEVKDTIVSTQEQINFPDVKKGYELTFDYDAHPTTERVYKKLKAIVKGLNGVVAEPTITDDTCSLTVHLPVTLEEATVFFDNYLKSQYNEHIKMSGSIYQTGYAFTASASEERIKEIKQDWVSFSNGGRRRELFQGKAYLTMVFQDTDDFIQNSSILGLSGTEVDGIKFTTDIELIKLKDAMNYNPNRSISPD